MAEDSGGILDQWLIKATFEAPKEDELSPLDIIAKKVEKVNTALETSKQAVNTLNQHKDAVGEVQRLWGSFAKDMGGTSSLDDRKPEKTSAERKSSDVIQQSFNRIASEMEARIDKVLTKAVSDLNGVKIGEEFKNGLAETRKIHERMSIEAQSVKEASLNIASMFDSAKTITADLKTAADEMRNVAQAVVKNGGFNGNQIVGSLFDSIVSTIEQNPKLKEIARNVNLTGGVPAQNKTSTTSSQARLKSLQSELAYEQNDYENWKNRGGNESVLRKQEDKIKNLQKQIGLLQKSNDAIEKQPHIKRQTSSALQFRSRDDGGDWVSINREKGDIAVPQSLTSSLTSKNTKKEYKDAFRRSLARLAYTTANNPNSSIQEISVTKPETQKEYDDLVQKYFGGPGGKKVDTSGIGGFTPIVRSGDQSQNVYLNPSSKNSQLAWDSVHELTHARRQAEGVQGELGKHQEYKNVRDVKSVASNEFVVGSSLFSQVANQHDTKNILKNLQDEFFLKDEESTKAVYDALTGGGKVLKKTGAKDRELDILKNAQALFSGGQVSGIDKGTLEHAYKALEQGFVAKAQHLKDLKEQATGKKIGSTKGIGSTRGYMRKIAEGIAEEESNVSTNYHDKVDNQLNEYPLVSLQTRAQGQFNNDAAMDQARRTVQKAEEERQKRSASPSHPDPRKRLVQESKEKDPKTMGATAGTFVKNILEKKISQKTGGKTSSDIGVDLSMLEGLPSGTDKEKARIRDVAIEALFGKHSLQNPEIAKGGISDILGDWSSSGKETRTRKVGAASNLVYRAIQTYDQPSIKPSKVQTLAEQFGRTIEYNSPRGEEQVHKSLDHLASLGLDSSTGRGMRGDNADFDKQMAAIESQRHEQEKFSSSAFGEVLGWDIKDFSYDWPEEKEDITKRSSKSLGQTDARKMRKNLDGALQAYGKIKGALKGLVSEGNINPKASNSEDMWDQEVGSVMEILKDAKVQDLGTVLDSLTKRYTEMSRQKSESQLFTPESIQSALQSLKEGNEALSGFQKQFGPSAETVPSAKARDYSTDMLNPYLKKAMSRLYQNQVVGNTSSKYGERTLEQSKKMSDKYPIEFEKPVEATKGNMAKRLQEALMFEKKAIQMRMNSDDEKVRNSVLPDERSLVEAVDSSDLTPEHFRYFVDYSQKYSSPSKVKAPGYETTFARQATEAVANIPDLMTRLVGYTPERGDSEIKKLLGVENPSKSAMKQFWRGQNFIDEVDVSKGVYGADKIKEILDKNIKPPLQKKESAPKVMAQSREALEFAKGNLNSLVGIKGGGLQTLTPDQLKDLSEDETTSRAREMMEMTNSKDSLKNLTMDEYKQKLSEYKSLYKNEGLHSAIRELQSGKGNIKATQYAESLGIKDEEGQQRFVNAMAVKSLFGTITSDPNKKIAQIHRGNLPQAGLERTEKYKNQLEEHGLSSRELTGFVRDNIANLVGVEGETGVSPLPTHTTDATLADASKKGKTKGQKEKSVEKAKELIKNKKLEFARQLQERTGINEEQAMKYSNIDELHNLLYNMIQMKGTANYGNVYQQSLDDLLAGMNPASNGASLSTRGQSLNDGNFFGGAVSDDEILKKISSGNIEGFEDYAEGTGFAKGSKNRYSDVGVVVGDPHTKETLDFIRKYQEKGKRVFVNPRSPDLTEYAKQNRSKSMSVMRGGGDKDELEAQTFQLLDKIGASFDGGGENSGSFGNFQEKPSQESTPKKKEGMYVPFKGITEQEDLHTFNTLSGYLESTYGLTEDSLETPDAPEGQNVNKISTKAALKMLAKARKRFAGNSRKAQYYMEMMQERREELIKSIAKNYTLIADEKEKSRGKIKKLLGTDKLKEIDQAIKEARKNIPQGQLNAESLTTNAKGYMKGLHESEKNFSAVDEYIKQSYSEEEVLSDNLALIGPDWIHHMRAKNYDLSKEELDEATSRKVAEKHNLGKRFDSSEWRKLTGGLLERFKSSITGKEKTTLTSRKRGQLYSQVASPSLDFARNEMGLSSEVLPDKDIASVVGSVFGGSSPSSPYNELVGNLLSSHSSKRDTLAIHEGPMPLDFKTFTEKASDYSSIYSESDNRFGRSNKGKAGWELKKFNDKVNTMYEHRASVGSMIHEELSKKTTPESAKPILKDLHEAYNAHLNEFGKDVNAKMDEDEILKRMKTINPELWAQNGDEISKYTKNLFGSERFKTAFKQEGIAKSEAKESLASYNRYKDESESLKGFSQVGEGEYNEAYKRAVGLTNFDTALKKGAKREDSIGLLEADYKNLAQQVPENADFKEAHQFRLSHLRKIIDELKGTGKLLGSKGEYIQEDEVKSLGSSAGIVKSVFDPAKIMKELAGEVKPENREMDDFLKNIQNPINEMRKYVTTESKEKFTHQENLTIDNLITWLNEIIKQLETDGGESNKYSGLINSLKRRVAVARYLSGQKQAGDDKSIVDQYATGDVQKVEENTTLSPAEKKLLTSKEENRIDTRLNSVSAANRFHELSPKQMDFYWNKRFADEEKGMAWESIRGHWSSMGEEKRTAVNQYLTEDQYNTIKLDMAKRIQEERRQKEEELKRLQVQISKSKLGENLPKRFAGLERNSMLELKNLPNAQVRNDVNVPENQELYPSISAKDLLSFSVFGKGQPQTHQFGNKIETAFGSKSNLGSLSEHQIDLINKLAFMSAGLQETEAEGPHDKLKGHTFAIPHQKGYMKNGVETKRDFLIGDEASDVDRKLGIDRLLATYTEKGEPSFIKSMEKHIGGNWKDISENPEELINALIHERGDIATRDLGLTASGESLLYQKALEKAGYKKRDAVDYNKRGLKTVWSGGIPQNAEDFYRRPPNLPKKAKGISTLSLIKKDMMDAMGGGGDFGPGRKLQNLISPELFKTVASVNPEARSYSARVLSKEELKRHQLTNDNPMVVGGTDDKDPLKNTIGLHPSLFGGNLSDIQGKLTPALTSGMQELMNRGQNVPQNVGAELSKYATDPKVIEQNLGAGKSIENQIKEEQDRIHKLNNERLGLLDDTGKTTDKGADSKLKKEIKQREKSLQNLTKLLPSFEKPEDLKGKQYSLKKNRIITGQDVTEDELIHGFSGLSQDIQSGKQDELLKQLGFEGDKSGILVQFIEALKQLLSGKYMQTGKEAGLSNRSKAFSSDNDGSFTGSSKSGAETKSNASSNEPSSSVPTPEGKKTNEEKKKDSNDGGFGGTGSDGGSDDGGKKGTSTGAPEPPDDEGRDVGSAIITGFQKLAEVLPIAAKSGENLTSDEISQLQRTISDQTSKLHENLKVDLSKIHIAIVSSNAILTSINSAVGGAKPELPHVKSAMGIAGLAVQAYNETHQKRGESETPAPMEEEEFRKEIENSRNRGEAHKEEMNKQIEENREKQKDRENEKNLKNAKDSSEEAAELARKQKALQDKEKGKGNNETKNETMPKVGDKAEQELMTLTKSTAVHIQKVRDGFNSVAKDFEIIKRAKVDPQFAQEQGIGNPDSLLEEMKSTLMGWKTPFYEEVRDKEGNVTEKRHGWNIANLTESQIGTEILQKSELESQIHYAKRLLSVLLTIGNTEEERQKNNKEIAQILGIQEKELEKNPALAFEKVNEKNAQKISKQTGQRVETVIGEKYAAGQPTSALVMSSKKEYESAVREAQRVQRATLAQEQSIGKLVKGVANRVVLYGGMSFALYGVIARVKESIALMTQFESQIVGVTKVMNPLLVNTEKISEAAKELGQTYGYSILETAEAMTVFAQQGKNASAVVTLAEASLLAANTTTMKAKEATEALTAALKQFTLADEEAISILDSWNSIENRTAITSQKLAETIKFAGTAAKMAGISFHELNGMVSAVGSATRESGSMLGRSFKYIISHLRTDEAVRAIQNLGVAVYNTDGNFRDGFDVISDLAGRWKDLSNVQQQNAAISIAGTRRYNNLLVLMDKWQDVARATSLSIRSQNSSMQENVKVINTLEKAMSQYRATTQSFMANLGEAGGIAIVTELADKFKFLFEIANKMPKGLQGAVATAGLFAGGGAMAMRGIRFSGMDYFLSRKRESGFMGRESNKSFRQFRKDNLGVSRAVVLANRERYDPYIQKLDSESAQTQIVNQTVKAGHQTVAYKTAKTEERTRIDEKNARIAKEKIELEKQYVSELKKATGGVESFANRFNTFFTKHRLAIGAGGLALQAYSQTLTDELSPTGRSAGGDATGLLGSSMMWHSIAGVGATNWIRNSDTSNKVFESMSKHFVKGDAAVKKLTMKSKTLVGTIAGLAVTIGLTTERWKDMLTHVNGSLERTRLIRNLEMERLKTIDDTVYRYERLKKITEDGNYSFADVEELREVEEILTRIAPEVAEIKNGKVTGRIKEGGIESLNNSADSRKELMDKFEEQFILESFNQSKGGWFSRFHETAYEERSIKINKLRKDLGKLQIAYEILGEKSKKAFEVGNESDFENYMDKMSVNSVERKKKSDEIQGLVGEQKKEDKLIKQLIEKSVAGDTRALKGLDYLDHGKTGELLSEKVAKTVIPKIKGNMTGDKDTKEKEYRSRVANWILGGIFGSIPFDQNAKTRNMAQDQGYMNVIFGENRDKRTEDSRTLQIKQFDLKDDKVPFREFETEVKAGYTSYDAKRAAARTIAQETEGLSEGDVFESVISTSQLSDSLIKVPLNSLKKFQSLSKTILESIGSHYDAYVEKISAPVELGKISIIEAENNLLEITRLMGVTGQQAENISKRFGKLPDNFDDILDRLRSFEFNGGEYSLGLGELKKLIDKPVKTLSDMYAAGRIAETFVNTTAKRTGELSYDYASMLRREMQISPKEKSNRGDDFVSNLTSTERTIDEIFKTAGMDGVTVQTISAEFRDRVKNNKATDDDFTQFRGDLKKHLDTASTILGQISGTFAKKIYSELNKASKESMDIAKALYGQSQNVHKSVLNKEVYLGREGVAEDRDKANASVNTLFNKLTESFDSQLVAFNSYIKSRESEVTSIQASKETDQKEIDLRKKDVFGLRNRLGQTSSENEKKAVLEEISKKESEIENYERKVKDANEKVFNIKSDISESKKRIDEIERGKGESGIINEDFVRFMRDSERIASESATSINEPIMKGVGSSQIEQLGQTDKLLSMLVQKQKEYGEGSQEVAIIGQKINELAERRFELQKKIGDELRNEIKQNKRLNVEYKAAQLLKLDVAQAQSAIESKRVKDVQTTVADIIPIFDQFKNILPESLTKDFESALEKTGHALKNVREADDASMRKGYILASAQEKAAYSWVKSMHEKGVPIEDIFESSGIKEMAKRSNLVGGLLDKYLKDEENKQLVEASKKATDATSVLAQVLTKASQEIIELKDSIDENTANQLVSMNIATALLSGKNSGDSFKALMPILKGILGKAGLTESQIEQNPHIQGVQTIIDQNTKGHKLGSKEVYKTLDGRIPLARHQATPAILHGGERVLSANEVDTYEKMGIPGFKTGSKNKTIENLQNTEKEKRAMKQSGKNINKIKQQEMANLGLTESKYNLRYKNWKDAKRNKLLFGKGDGSLSGIQNSVINHNNKLEMKRVKNLKKTPKFSRWDMLSIPATLAYAGMELSKVPSEIEVAMQGGNPSDITRSISSPIGLTASELGYWLDKLSNKKLGQRANVIGGASRALTGLASTTEAYNEYGFKTGNKEALKQLAIWHGETLAYNMPLGQRLGEAYWKGAKNVAAKGWRGARQGVPKGLDLSKQLLKKGSQFADDGLTAVDDLARGALSNFGDDLALKTRAGYGYLAGKSSLGMSYIKNRAGSIYNSASAKTGKIAETLTKQRYLKNAIPKSVLNKIPSGVKGASSKIASSLGDPLTYFDIMSKVGLAMEGTGTYMNWLNKDKELADFKDGDLLGMFLKGAGGTINNALGTAIVAPFSKHVSLKDIVEPTDEEKTIEKEFASLATNNTTSYATTFWTKTGVAKDIIDKIKAAKSKNEKLEIATNYLNEAKKSGAYDTRAMLRIFNQQGVPGFEFIDKRIDAINKNMSNKKKQKETEKALEAIEKQNLDSKVKEKIKKTMIETSYKDWIDNNFGKIFESGTLDDYHNKIAEISARPSVKGSGVFEGTSDKEMLSGILEGLGETKGDPMYSSAREYMSKRIDRMKARFTKGTDEYYNEEQTRLYNEVKNINSFEQAQREQRKQQAREQGDVYIKNYKTALANKISNIRKYGGSQKELEYLETHYEDMKTWDDNKEEKYFSKMYEVTQVGKTEGKYDKYIKTLEKQARKAGSYIVNHSEYDENGNIVGIIGNREKMEKATEYMEKKKKAIQLAKKYYEAGGKKKEELVSYLDKRYDNENVVKNINKQIYLATRDKIEGKTKESMLAQQMSGFKEIIGSYNKPDSKGKIAGSRNEGSLAVLHGDERVLSAKEVDTLEEAGVPGFKKGSSSDPITMSNFTEAYKNPFEPIIDEFKKAVDDFHKTIVSQKESQQIEGTMVHEGGVEVTLGEDVVNLLEELKALISEAGDKKEELKVGQIVKDRI